MKQTLLQLRYFLPYAKRKGRCYLNNIEPEKLHEGIKKK